MKLKPKSKKEIKLADAIPVTGIPVKEEPKKEVKGEAPKPVVKEYKIETHEAVRKDN